MAIPLTLVFDDDDPSIYNEAFQRMEALNLKGTNACITGFVGNTGLYTLAQITEMYEAGWDICSHTNNHVDLNSETDQEVIDAVSTAQDYLNNNGFTRADDILVAPRDEIDERVLSLITPYVVMATTRIDNGIDTANDLPLDLMRIRRRGVANNSPQTVIDWIDDAILKGQYLHLNFHKISDNGTGLDYPPADFQTVIEYIAEKRDAGDVEVLTLSQLYNKYASSPRVHAARRTMPRDSGYNLVFDGSGDVVNITDSSSLAFSGTQPITIAARLKPNSTDTMRIVSQGTEIILRTNGTTKEYEFILNSFTTNDRVVAGTVVPGEEAYVVGVYDGTDILLYVNGSMVERTTPTGAYIDNGSVWKIGHDSAEQFGGSIDEVRIFNTAWSQDEVVTWGKTGAAPSTGQVGAWLMAEGTGSSVADSSGNGNTGTIVNATWNTAQSFSSARASSARRFAATDYGTSLRFNGTTSEVAIGSSINLTGPFTITWWESLRARSNLRMVIGESDSVSAKVGHSSSKYFVRVVNGGSSDNTISLPQENDWTALALTRDDNGKVDLWINGTANRLFSDAAQSGTFTFNRIGSSQGTSRFLGDLNSFRVWDEKLSTSGIQRISYNNILPPTPAILDYEMNEGSGTTLIDSSPSGNNGTTTGTSYSSNVPASNRSSIA